jgi:hypothetical protein
VTGVLWLPVFVAMGFNAWVYRSIARWKKPARCKNCGLRPKWAFDTSARGKEEIMRDHVKVCL